jgi:adenylate kinase
VPDDVTIAMVKARLSEPDCQRGTVLDGFPRTIPQAEALAEIAEEFSAAVGPVVLIEVPAETLVERLSGRWMSQSGRVYHSLYNPPKVPGKDDIDGSDLYQREDDKPATVRNRIEVYENETAPLITHYEARNVLRIVNGDQTIDEVTQSILAELES